MTYEKRKRKGKQKRKNRQKRREKSKGKSEGWTISNTSITQVHYHTLTSYPLPEKEESIEGIVITPLEKSSAACSCLSL